MRHSIALDSSYQDTLFGLAISEGLVRKPPSSDAIVDDCLRAAKGIRRQRVLEYLLFCDTVHLAGSLVGVIDIQPLVDEGLVEDHRIPAETGTEHLCATIEESLPVLLQARRLLDISNRSRLHKYFTLEGRQKRKELKIISDFLIFAFGKTRMYTDPVSGTTVHASENAVHQVLAYASNSDDNEAFDVAIERAVGYTLPMQLELLTASHLMLHSASYAIPFATQRFRTFADRPKTLDKYPGHALRLCQIAFEQNLRSLPPLSSLADVLRMRDDPRIVSLRSRLHQWHKCLETISDAELVKEIALDIRKSTEEMLRIGKWRPVSRWLVWLSLATALIPVVGVVAAVAAFGVGHVIEKKNAQHSWVGLGR